MVWASEATELTWTLGNGLTPFSMEGLAQWIEMAPSLAVFAQELIEEYAGNEMLETVN